MRKAVEAMAAALAEAWRDPRVRREHADLREACAAVPDELPLLLARHRGSGERQSGNPVAVAMERLLALLEGDLLPIPAVEPAGTPETALVLSGVDRLLPGGLAAARVLDLRAGGGDLVAALLPRARATFALEGRLVPYYRASARLGTFEGIAFADPLALPPLDPTPSFDFLFDENAERLRRIREAEVNVVVGDLRHGEGGKGTLSAYVRWAARRLKGEGVVAFVSNEDLVDEPSLGPLRAELEREFDLIAHVAGVTFLVRDQARRGRHGPRLLYGEETADDFDALPWRELRPAGQVWRTEILRPEWAGLMPFAGDRALFLGTHEGVRGTASTPEDRRARPVLSRPFVTVSRRPERGAAWPEGPLIVVTKEPFGVFVAAAPPDRRCAGPVVAFALRDLAPAALSKLRTRYGPGVTPRDAFDYAVALLHHPEYRERYREDLRRGLPRLPLLEGLETLGEIEEAPPVGPGTAFGTGWTPRDLFAPGTIPDYDDPFASPYARADVEPGFLLFAGMGAALARAQTQFADIQGDPLEWVATGDDPTFARLRLSRDRARVTVSPTLRLEGIPPETFEYRIGAKSALEWLVSGHRGGSASAAARRVGQVVAASLETNRLVGVLEGVGL